MFRVIQPYFPYMEKEMAEVQSEPEVQEILLLKHAQTTEEAKRKEKERKEKDLLIISSVVLTKSNCGISFGK